MLPIPLMVALMLAFGLGEQLPALPVAKGDVGPRLLDTAVSLILAASTSLGVGFGLASTIRKRGGYRPISRRVHSILSMAVEVMNLGVYAWILFGLGWVSLVRNGLGLKGLPIIDESLILLPYLLAVIAGWIGLYPVSRALSLTRSDRGLARYILLRTRVSLGLVLPALFIYTLGGEAVQRLLGPELSATWWVQLGTLGGLGLIVLTVSPALVRITLPTSRLEPGPLRDRLERQAKRLGFRSTDILVWNTGGAVLNAGVTGLFPWFRYVLLSDALVACLTPSEVAAVFGHEVGHIRHRHLNFFGFFMVGSAGVIALAFHFLETRIEPSLIAWTNETIAAVVVVTLTVAALAAYFFFVFGALSRLFERQADIFGAKSVSCDSEICPPHAEVDLDEIPNLEAARVCPVGVYTFVEALRSVASHNAINSNSFSWRHGSINGRIAYLESLMDAPDDEPQFQRKVLRRKTILALCLVVAFTLAVVTGAIGVVVNS